MRVLPNIGLIDRYASKTNVFQMSSANGDISDDNDKVGCDIVYSKKDLVYAIRNKCNNCFVQLYTIRYSSGENTIGLIFIVKVSKSYGEGKCPVCRSSTGIKTYTKTFLWPLRFSAALHGI
ncbi:hypothetical protein ACJMK2_032263 [Sinanodonta woodiana]|uniref:Uncharacterized protein n=1 Tax=Sinanodonta woodiana TaxID=1069815 RepID=A0ABD3X2Q2_SINWO